MSNPNLLHNRFHPTSTRPQLRSQPRLQSVQTDRLHTGPGRERTARRWYDRLDPVETRPGLRGLLHHRVHPALRGNLLDASWHATGPAGAQHSQHRPTESLDGGHLKSRQTRRLSHHRLSDYSMNNLQRFTGDSLPNDHLTMY